MITIENAVFCRTPGCPATMRSMIPLYNCDWATNGRCPFCSKRVARLIDHIRLPSDPRLVERTEVVTTYRADGAARGVAA